MNGTGGGSAELEAMKQDILREMRKEIAKAKLEIIEGGVTWHSSSLTLYTCKSVAFLISKGTRQKKGKMWKIPHLVWPPPMTEIVENFQKKNLKKG